MHAFLIIGGEGTKLAVKHKAKILIFTLQKIDDVRDLRKLVKLSFSEKTAILIEDIDTATTEAQNAFLKNLEEPQINLIYILTAKNLHNVLPTIQSRCEVTKVLQVKQVLQVKKETKQYLKQNIDGKFEIINKIKDRGIAIGFVEGLIFHQREQRKYKNMKNYLNTLRNLKANGNISLQLSNMLVSS